MDEGCMPSFSRIVAEGSIQPMNSVYPTVSSVAWTSFMTGVNPGKHGIYGFADRKPGTYKIYIPTANNVRSPTLWETLSGHGKRVIVMNVPVTYPPREVNGILIAGFLSPNLDKIAYPPAVSEKLKGMEYRIDMDPWQARESKEKMLEDFHLTLAKRVEVMLQLMDNEPWDFFMCHIMETDRLHHFLWEDMENGGEPYTTAFYRCYAEIDHALGQVRERLDDDITLIILSDHGFCTLTKEVYINHWLAENGWLQFDKEPPESIEDIASESRAYSLDPGRIYINLKGREPAGSIAPGQEYEQLREDLAQALLELRDPQTGRSIVRQAFRREELYSGPYLAQAPDLVAVPYDGYDLKGPVNKGMLTFKGPLVGMHTYDNAMFYVSKKTLASDGITVMDAMPTILRLMDLPVLETLDGQVVA